MTTALWADALFSNADYGTKITNQANKLYAVGVMSYEDHHGRDASYNTPSWVSLHATESEAMAAANAKVHDWNGTAWVTHVVVNHGRKRIASIDKPLARCGDYRAPNSAELHKRLGI